MSLPTRKVALATLALFAACTESPTTPSIESTAIVSGRRAAASELIVESDVLWTNGQATAINDAGVIVGVQTINGAQKTVRWENGVLTVVAGVPDGFTPRTLTNDGKMLGTYANRAAIWTGSSFVQPQAPPGQYFAQFSNFSGVIGGITLVPVPGNVILTPFRFDGSTVTLLQAPGFLGGSVNDLNIAGQMVGVLGSGPGSRPFIFSNGSLTVLPVPPGTSSTVMQGINEEGEAFGQAFVPPSTFVPLLWRNGTYEVIPAPNGTAMAHSIGENNKLILRDPGFANAYYHFYDGTVTTRLFPLSSANVAGVNRDGFIIGSTAGASPNAMRWRVVEKPIDNTPPVVTASVSGTQGENGWYTSDVTVSWSVTDAESPVTSSACPSTSITADTDGVDVTCSATSTGGTSSVTETVKRDATAPVITFGGNQSTYSVSDNVSISCSATDATSGIDQSDCPSVNAPAYTLVLGANTLAASATDFAGLSSNASASFTVVVDAAGLKNLLATWVTSAGVAKSLSAKLDNALSASGPSRAGKISAFINEVEAQAGKSISAEHAALLISMAQGL